MNSSDTRGMPVSYPPIPTHLFQQNLRSNENFANAHHNYPYPLTPYPKIPKIQSWLSFSAESFINPVDITKHEGTQKVTNPSTHLLPSLCHSVPSMSLKVSSTELQRVLDSILDQIDWLEVAVKVARNRAPSIYCNIIKMILRAHIYQLVRIEGEDVDAANIENSRDRENCILVDGGDDEKIENRSGFIEESGEEEDSIEGGNDNGDTESY